MVVGMVDVQDIEPLLPEISGEVAEVHQVLNEGARPGNFEGMIEMKTGCGLDACLSDPLLKAVLHRRRWRPVGQKDFMAPLL